ncbi:MAG: 2-succinyl-5-enolpyruvyl-6-hydroxy-3-cyclohexene-1-carboxylic-acid synthase [Ruminococcus flavefaciens]|nr:2-succinyl-5-enolpyruvyl-6-hydroxy-3-cyclohexene-1-carboxylic-acid synthase [Ruminococcus flavefaciens]
MYSSLKNIQILVSLLKQYGIKHIVISAGTRHTPFVYSVEHDDFFETYSVVDERSASFFAIGMIEKLRVPVAVVCTSGTAAANYVSAANEAFYQQLPLLILTADRNHYYMFQQEEQMIPQENLYSSVCKKVVTLNHVRDEKDFWYTSRICNEALLELVQGEKGPVHINFIVENDYPLKKGIVDFKTDKLPPVKKIERLTLEDTTAEWRRLSNKISGKKILIVYGQHGLLNKQEQKAIDDFTEKYNCVVSTDLLSNLKNDYAVKTFVLSRLLSSDEISELCPDFVFTVNANTISEIKGSLTPFKSRFEHWHISAKGQVSDPFKCLSNVVQCSPFKFFKRMAALRTENSNHDFFEDWKNVYSRIGDNGSLNDEDIRYSSMYAIQQYIKNIPSGSLLHIANSNSVRLSNYFDLADNIEVYDNRGTHGIDGSMSAFIGQAHLKKDGLAFLVIGDLSFFYDMNALWNSYVRKNIRILVCNNSGGAIFYSFPNTQNVPTLGDHIAAVHENSVRKWTEDRGFKYLSASDKSEFDDALKELISAESDCPVLLEVFTDKEIDADCIRTILTPYRQVTLKQKISDKIPQSVKKAIKGVLK